MRYCDVCQKKLRKQKTYCSRACLKIGYTGRRHSEDALKKMRGRKLSSETIARQNLKKLRGHVRIEGNFPCHRCSKHFNSNTSLRSHMSYCTDEIEDQQSAACGVCGQTFKSNPEILHLAGPKWWKQRKTVKFERLRELRKDFSKKSAVLSQMQ